MKTHIVLASLLALGAFLPVASAAERPDLPPVYVCVAAVNGPCWHGGDVCVGFSYQIPQCVYTGLVCTEICSPCTYIQCEIAMGLPEPAPAEPMCLYYYYEVDTGIVRYVARDSCHSEVYVLGERILPLA